MKYVILAAVMLISTPSLANKDDYSADNYGNVYVYEHDSQAYPQHDGTGLCYSVGDGWNSCHLMEDESLTWFLEGNDPYDKIQMPSEETCRRIVAINPNKQCWARLNPKK